MLDQEEAARMRDYDGRVMEIIQVDEFTYDAFARETAAAEKQPPQQKTRRRRGAPAEAKVE